MKRTRFSEEQSIAIAVAETGRTGEVRFLGEIRIEAAAVIKLTRKIGRSYPSVLYWPSPRKTPRVGVEFVTERRRADEGEPVQ